ncbi:MAG: hypothetical protein LKI24_09080 [Acidipropionibacterium sp.]|nr:hypothetical protein [Acidipropionibacterium sp.]
MSASLWTVDTVTALVDAVGVGEDEGLVAARQLVTPMTTTTAMAEPACDARFVIHGNTDLQTDALESDPAPVHPS